MSTPTPALRGLSAVRIRAQVKIHNLLRDVKSIQELLVGEYRDCTFPTASLSLLSHPWRL